MLAYLCVALSISYLTRDSKAITPFDKLRKYPDQRQHSITSGSHVPGMEYRELGR